MLAKPDIFLVHVIILYNDILPENCMLKDGFFIGNVVEFVFCTRFVYNRVERIAR